MLTFSANVGDDGAGSETSFATTISLCGAGPIACVGQQVISVSSPSMVWRSTERFVGSTIRRDRTT
jgi:hypothetical protein